MTEYVDNKEIRRVFPEEYNTGLKAESPKDCEKHPTVELDEVTGLPIIEKETVYSKYGIFLKDNSFHNSCQSFFDKTGFLTPKQLNALR